MAGFGKKHSSSPTKGWGTRRTDFGARAFVHCFPGTNAIFNQHRGMAITPPVSLTCTFGDPTEGKTATMTTERFNRHYPTLWCRPVLDQEIHLGASPAAESVVRCVPRFGSRVSALKLGVR
jgi:hypothetical protein